LFKSHERFSTVAKGGKYLYVARNPLDAFISFYHFLPSFMGLPAGAITVEEFADAIFAGVSVSGGIWAHFDGWFAQRHDPNVLFIFYESLKQDLRG
jgi:aryl sulfotransferase